MPEESQTSAEQNAGPSAGGYNVEDLALNELDAAQIAGGTLLKNDWKGKGECRTDGKPVER